VPGGGVYKKIMSRKKYVWKNKRTNK
jgi:hypothetical protein